MLVEVQAEELFGMLERRGVASLVLICALASGLGATPAQAQEGTTTATPESARDLFARGQSAYRQGDYAAAADLWSRAYALDPRPQLQYNLAQAYGRLGRMEDERAALSRFIAETTPDDPLLASSRARLAMLEQRISQTGIVLEGADYEGAVVRIDGEERGRLPHPDPFFLHPGSHDVEVSLEGYAPFRATVVVPAGESVDVTVALTPSAAPSAAEPASMALPIALYSVGGALVVTGAIMGGLALSNTADGPVEGTGPADRAHAFSIVSDVTLGVGIAAGAAGLVVHLLRRRHADGEDRASLSLTPLLGRGNVGLGASGRF
jgi:hypothetical protein